MTCYVVQGFNLAYFLTVVLACLLLCRPLAYLWDHSIDGVCGDQKSLDLFIGAFNLAMDTTTVALPMPVLWGLQARTKKKVIITGMFSMGLACVLGNKNQRGSLMLMAFTESALSPWSESKQQQTLMRRIRRSSTL